MNSANCLLFVMGMHRSGTSALCAALNASGADFGSHLLGPMKGVNEEGFWEDSEVVAINELLLAQVGAQWYSVAEEHLEIDWRHLEFDEARNVARKVLKRGFGSKPVQAVKDPRFCITLPFWLDLCKDVGLPARVCVISRAPEEIGLSLEKRDGFPLGYGLRLFQVYRRGISKSAPSDTIYISYDDLIHNPGGVVREFSRTLPLAENEELASSAVRKDLRHHSHVQKQGLLRRPDTGAMDFSILEEEIQKAHPIDQALVEFANNLVNRGKKLSQLGELHSKALATIDERDEQIRVFDERLSEIGRLHTQALEIIKEHDARLALVLKIPGIGLIFKMMLNHETR
jgi:hypothetical protein